MCFMMMMGQLILQFVVASFVCIVYASAYDLDPAMMQHLEQERAILADIQSFLSNQAVPTNVKVSKWITFTFA